MVSNKGVSYEYHGDRITWIWPWSRKKEGGTFYSSLYDETFDTIHDYWMKKGQVSTALALNKSLYFNLEYVIADFARNVAGHNEYLVVVINQRLLPLLESRDPKFIKALRNKNPDRIEGLSKSNSVMFSFQDSSSASAFIRNIPLEAGFAMLITNGHLVSTNNYLALLEKNHERE